MFGALLLFEDEFIHVVAISFTALILTELVMVALTIRTWHPIMLLAELASILIYFLSLIVIRDFFGSDFIQFVDFVSSFLSEPVVISLICNICLTFLILFISDILVIL